MKILISISVIYRVRVWNRVVNQAYMQAHDLERDVYVIPGPSFDLQLSIVLKLLKPRYGLIESGDSLLNNYTLYLKKKLGLKYNPVDLSFFYRNRKYST